MTVPEIVDKFEVPQEYHNALWEAYSEGAKRGFIDAGIKGLLGNADNDLKPLTIGRRDKMSKVIQVSVTGIDNNSTTQANYVTTILTDDGKTFQTDDTHAEWIEL
jgi:hypothetical protein